MIAAAVVAGIVAVLVAIALPKDLKAWRAQAARPPLDYLDVDALYRDGLIDQNSDRRAS